MEEAKEKVLLDIEDLKRVELDKILNIVFDVVLLIFAVIGGATLASWVIAAPWPVFALKFVAGALILATLPIVGFTTLVAIFDIASEYLDAKMKRRQLEELL